MHIQEIISVWVELFCMLSRSLSHSFTFNFASFVSFQRASFVVNLRHCPSSLLLHNFYTFILEFILSRFFFRLLRCVFFFHSTFQRVIFGGPGKYIAFIMCATLVRRSNKLCKNIRHHKRIECVWGALQSDSNVADSVSFRSLFFFRAIIQCES